MAIIHSAISYVSARDLRLFNCRINNLSISILLILIGLCGVRNKNTVILGIILGVLSIAYFFLRGGRTSYFDYVFVGIGSVLMGLAFSTKEEKIEAVSNSQSNSFVHNEIEQITKLKELLDKGVITQEEFDEKKKQFLGL